MLRKESVYLKSQRGFEQQEHALNGSRSLAGSMRMKHGMLNNIEYVSCVDETDGRYWEVLLLLRLSLVMVVERLDEE